MNTQSKLFGKTIKGQDVYEYILSEDNGISVSLISYGAAIKNIILPNGIDIVLGFDSIEGYELHDKYMGATIGRCANRIKNGVFILNGQQYFLKKNNGKNHLHGGEFGFDKRVWTGQIIDNSVVFSLMAEDGEEGYPGNLEVKVEYSLVGNKLKIKYYAVSDKDTIVNITNHTYFNLNGQSSGSIDDHLIKIHASRYIEIDESGCSMDMISSVDDTCFDFREFKKIDQDIENDCEQIKRASGYDHNFVLKSAYSSLQKKAAQVIGSDVKLTVYTDQCGIHFYSGNFLECDIPGKEGMIYANRSGFALEAQNWPDAINHSDFPNAVLRKGEEYRRKITYEIEY